MATKKIKKSAVIVALMMVAILFVCMTACKMVEDDPATYTVTYDANGATSGTAPETQTKIEGTALTLASNSGNLVKTGYSFAGWNTKADGKGTDYAVGASYTADAAITLYAKWTQLPTYTVTYDKNGATSGTVPANQTKIQGTAIILAGNSGNLVKTGLNFAGWNTKADGTGTDIADGASYTADATITLYAKWTTLLTYAITYNANNATSGTVPTNQTKIQGTALTLAANSGSLVKTGYTFAGWNTKAEGTGTSYAVGASYTTDEAVTLYAKWTTLPTYTVTYNANGATGGNAPANQTKIQGTALTLAANSGSLVKTGYTFAGWNTQADGKGTDYAVGASYTADAAITLYAKWTQLPTYAITYDKNGATSGTAPANQTKIQGTALTLAANSGSLVKTGYTFAGWNTQADGKGDDYAVSASYTADAATTLYAKWTTATYNVTYDANGATGGNAPDAQTKTHGTALSLAANSGNLAKTNYTFVGWNTQADGKGTPYAVGASYTTDEAVTLYAKWTITTYTVTYDANGATGGNAPDAQTKTHGTTLLLATNTGNLVKTNYTFVGWNTKADGKGTDYAIGASYTTDEAITLYAWWVDSVGKELSNLTIGGTLYNKTSEVVAIADGTTAIVHKTDASSWSNYNGDGVFVTGREVTLSPFIMGKYEVTQDLYQAVMGTNPSSFKDSPATGETQGRRPVEKVTWYDAVAFCNALTKLTMNESDCVYTITGITKTGDTITAATVTADHTKKGYRLPTEAEWEFAARGGDPDGSTWGYAYAGVQTEKAPGDFTSSESDIALNDFGWYKNNSGDKTHEVGTTLEQNALGLCDMSGNVWELCYDLKGDVTTIVVTDPLGAASGTARVDRGGCFSESASMCSISFRGACTPSESFNYLGFRVCRSQ